MTLRKLAIGLTREGRPYLADKETGAQIADVVSLETYQAAGSPFVRVDVTLVLKVEK